MSNISLQGSDAPITQITDVAKVNGPGVTSSAQLTATKSACSMIEVQAFEGNTAPIAIGGSGVVLGTSPGYANRVGVVIAPGASKVIATTDPSLWYISGLAGDFVTYTIYK